MRELKRAVLLLALASALSGGAFAVSPSYWTHKSEADFRSGELNGVSVSSLGTVMLSRKVENIGGLEEVFVWCMAGDAAGNVYLGTGGKGRIFKVSPGGDANVLAEVEESNVTAMAPSLSGGVYAATSPGAIIYRVSSRGEATRLADLDETYVWSLATDKDDTLYVATGEKGIIYRIKLGGEPEVLYDSPEGHMVALALDGSGKVYAGTYPHGLVYRIDEMGKAFVLFDADEDEIHALAVGGDGAVFAATASGGRATLAGYPVPPEAGGQVEGPMMGGTDFMASAAAKGMPRQGGGEQPEAPPTAAIPPQQPGTNSIYKISPDGLVERLFSVGKTLIYSLALAPDGSLFAGVGAPGRVYQVMEKDQAILLYKAEEAQVLCLCVQADGTMVFGTGNIGRAKRMMPERAEHGTMVSTPLDARLHSKWGTLGWTADLPEGTAVSFATRAGNSSTPDDTWSEWSPEVSKLDSAIASPAARFLQYRATLSTNRKDATPVLSEVKLAYQTFNRAPEVLSIGAGQGPSQPGPGPQPRPPQPPLPGVLNVSWKVQDPNGDSLIFKLYYRRVDEEKWKLLEKDLEQPPVQWDTTSVPDGEYLLRVVASDSPSNPEGTALERERTSDPVTIDNTRPVIAGVSVLKKEKGGWSVTGQVRDEGSTVEAVEYSIDGGEWKALGALDGIFDSKEEYFSFDIEKLEAGEHSVVIRASDARGNINATSAAINAD